MISGSANSEAPILYMAGAVIYVPGKPSKSLYIVKRGEVRIFKLVNNKIQLTHLCVAGDILNDVSVLTNKSLDHGAIAYSDVEIITVDAKDVRTVIEKCPKWIPDIFSTLCERLIDSQEIIFEHNLQAGQLDKKLIVSKDEEKILTQKVLEFKM